MKINDEILLIEKDLASAQNITNYFANLVSTSVFWVKTVDFAEQYIVQRVPVCILVASSLSSSFHKLAFSDTFSLKISKIPVLFYGESGVNSIINLPNFTYTTSTSADDLAQISSLFAEIPHHSINDTTKFVQQNELFYSAITDAVPDILFVLDLIHKKIIYANKSLEVLLDYSLAEINELETHLFYPDDFENLNYHYQNLKSFKKGEFIASEYRIKHKNGKYIWFNIKTLVFETDADEQPTQIIGFAQEVTERKRALEILQLDELRLLSMVQLNQMVDKPLIEILNFAIDEAAQLTKSSIGYLYFVDKFSEKDLYFFSSLLSENEFEQAKNKISSDIEEKKIFEFIIQQNIPWINNEIIQNDFSIIKNQIHVPLMDNNHIVAIVGVANKADEYNESDIFQLKLLMDGLWKIKHRKEAEAQLIRAKEHAEESDKLKTNFLNTISHEIRTPLNAIIGFSSLLNESKRDEDTVGTFSLIIQKNGYDLLDIINKIIEFSRLESGNILISESDFFPHELINEIFERYELKINEGYKRNVTFNIVNNLSNALVKLYTDKDNLKSILFNLIDNAFKFTLFGEINITIGLVDRSTLLFCISDTGIGVLKEKQAVIFEKFRQADEGFTRKFGGTGLGLAIAKALTKTLGGNIWLESEVNLGSKFYFTIKPNSIEIQENIEEKVSVLRKYSWENRNILIVEDEYVNFEFLNEVLTRTKANVFFAATGSSAIEISMRQRIDLILMDIQLPDISGYEVTSQIRKQNSNIPIIAQTAYASDDDKNRCFAAGCNDFIAKPINFKILLQKIDKLLSLDDEQND